MTFNQQLEQLLKTLDKFTDKEGNLLKQNIKDSSEKFDTDLIKLLLSDKDTKEHFFDEIDDATIFNYRKFIDYIDDKNFLIDSYTKFSNKVGLTISNKHLQQINDVVLSFPFKDCVLEGGQSKDDEKRKEIFFNEVLAKDEINRLLDEKVITNATRFSAPLRGEKYTKDKARENIKFNRDENGLIKDNLIIKGNNLLALHTLKSNFAGKVKLIYIDPPYNTGNDSFNYNDNFNHSTWLTFMKNRLEVARALLRDDGVIFVQCDDNEQAYLKVLMDEIFGRDNFVGDLIRKTKSSTNDAKTGFNMQHENTLIFAKNKNNISLKGDKKRLDNYSNLDNDINGDWVSSDPSARTGNTKFEIKNPKTGQIDLPPKGRCWAFSKGSFNNFVKSGKIKFKNTVKKNERGFIYKSYKNNLKNLFYLLNSLDGCKNQYMNQVATKERNNLLDDSFEYPKPEEFIKIIINSVTEKGDIVLDYHLGSGTTCAVAHKMGRQYIGIEQMDYIEDIAVKRMQKVIGETVKKDGELLESVAFDNGGISKAVDWIGGGEFIYFELDKYNQKYIDELSNATDKTILKLYDEILEKAFLNYDVESKKLLENKKDFATLSLNEQQAFLISILNKNQLYKNRSEIDDKELLLDEKTKQLNKDFYNN